MLGLLTGAIAAGHGEDDRELVRRVASGDQQALRALYDRCAGQLLALSLRVLRDRRDAEEVVQEAFVDLWRRADSFDPARGSVLGFLVSIVRSRSIDRLRSRNAAERMRSSAAAEPQAEPAAAPSELVEVSSLRGRIRRALEQLAPNQKAAIELAYFEGLSQREIAERLGDPIGTVKTRVRTGLQKLSALLAEEAAP